ncbi:hypothetical protein Plhal304r1_c057g0143241 [Plasmopara halstedii]
MAQCASFSCAAVRSSIFAETSSRRSRLLKALPKHSPIHLAPLGRTEQSSLLCLEFTSRANEFCYLQHSLRFKSETKHNTESGNLSYLTLSGGGFVPVEL